MKVHRVGGSLMVGIPAEIARHFQIEPGDEVDVRESDSMIVIEPRRAVSEMLARWDVLDALVTGEEVAAALHAEREGRWSS